MSSQLLRECFVKSTEELNEYTYAGKSYIRYNQNNNIRFEPNTLIYLKYDSTKKCINVYENHTIKLLLLNVHSTKCWYPYYKLCISPSRFHVNSRLLIEYEPSNISQLRVNLYIKLDAIHLNNNFGNHILTEYIIKQNTINNFGLNGYTCKDADVITMNNDLWIEGAKRNFFPHQMNNIEWACSRELIPTLKSIPTMSVNFIRASEVELVIHNNHNRILTPSLLPTTTIYVNGGMLCDEVGLGKTYTFLGLCLKNKVNCTLIICPGYLCNHWYNEILEYTNLSVCRICSIVQFNKYHTTNCKYDIVICSFNIFVNEKCLSNNLYKSIHEIYFDRIIIDEVHTLFEQNTKKHKLIIDTIQECMLHARHKWLCTSTPNFDYKDRSVYYIQKYLQLLTTSDIQLRDFEYSYTELFDEIVRKNTLHSINNILHIPSPNIENIFLDPTEVEKIIYQTALNDRQKQIELCSHILVSDVNSSILDNKVVSVEDATKKFISYYTKRLEYYTKRDQSLDCASIGFAGTQTIDELNDMKAKTKQIISEAVACLQIFQNLESKLMDDCPICFQSLTNVNPTVAICGHIYCTSCISTMFNLSKEKINCALCRKSLKNSDFNTLQTANYQPLSTEAKWGTKMSAIISYINSTLSNPDRRIIIFSKFNKMLKLIEQTLIDSGLDTIRVKGAPFHAAALIHKFKTETKYRIIMLCSENMSSGINLTEATDVILLDTFTVDSPILCKALETQAIGRAVRLGQTKTVQVRRFIMRNSIEEQLFKRNCQD